MIELSPLPGNVILVLLSLSMVLAFVRLVRGPSLSDRVVALDLMTTIAVAVIAAYGAIHRQAVLLEVAAVLALVSFVGTVAFARYLEERARR